MNYTGSVVLSFSHFIEKEATGNITPNEIRAAGEEFACQMEALEQEGWEKNGKIYWDKRIDAPQDKQFYFIIRYCRKFLGKGHFLQELELTEKAGFNINKATVVLIDINGGEGVIWSNEKDQR